MSEDTVASTHRKSVWYGDLVRERKAELSKTMRPMALCVSRQVHDILKAEYVTRGIVAAGAGDLQRVEGLAVLIDEASASEGICIRGDKR
jgi:hypothetical protein